MAELQSVWFESTSTALVYIYQKGQWKHRNDIKAFGVPAAF